MGAYILGGGCIQGQRISLSTSESRCCSNFRSLPVGHPRALWGEGMGWHGLETQTEGLIKPSGLQTPARASQAVELGLPATWAPAAPPPLAPHSWRAAAPDVASLVDGGLSCQGSEPAGPPDTGLGSHWRDLSSSSQPRAARQGSEIPRPAAPPGPLLCVRASLPATESCSLWRSLLL